MTTDQPPAREHSLDRERKAGQSITGKMMTITTFPYTAPQGTMLIQVPFSLTVICCDPLWKDGSLWNVWDQQSQFVPAGQGDHTSSMPVPHRLLDMCRRRKIRKENSDSHFLESKCQAREDKCITLGDAV